MTERKQLKPSRIPSRWDDVTPAWMTAAIASRHPDAVVNAVSIITRDDGSNRRARFELSYGAGTGPRRVFLKAHNPRHRWVHFRNGNLWNEARLFASGVPLPVDHPVVYRSIVDYLRLDFLLVMEDLALRGADPRDATRPMTVDQVANGLRGLARLHSRYWQTHDSRLRWMKVFRPTAGWQVGLRRRIPTGLARGGTALPEDVAKYSGDEILQFWSRYVATLSRGPMTLLHGDAHIGNTYVLPNGDVGFLDWQVTRRGAWHQDLGHFMIGALTIGDRRAHERDLLAEYRRALELPEDQKPSPEAAWLAYRTTPAYGLGIWLSTLGTDGYQSREISLALAQRFAAAFVELENLSAFAQAGT